MTQETTPDLAAWLRTKIDRRERLNVELDYCQPITMSVKEACYILAALTNPTDCCAKTREAFVAGYRAAHFDPTYYDVGAAALEAWADHAAIRKGADT